jgi:hypothetical protein
LIQGLPPLSACELAPSFQLSIGIRGPATCLPASRFVCGLLVLAHAVLARGSKLQRTYAMDLNACQPARTCMHVCGLFHRFHDCRISHPAIGDGRRESIGFRMLRDSLHCKQSCYHGGCLLLWRLCTWESGFSIRTYAHICITTSMFR